MNSATKKPVRWSLVLGLGAMALVRPFLSMIGAMDALGRPAGPLVVTVLISLIWLGVVVLVRDPRPLLTLVLSGLVYAVLAMLIGTLLGGDGGFPIANPFAIVSVLATNVAWGAVVGLVAMGVLRIRRP